MECNQIELLKSSVTTQLIDAFDFIHTKYRFSVVRAGPENVKGK